ncbi:MAG: hypothetical protein ABJA79_00475 [Parafilimonas sp.]
MIDSIRNQLTEKEATYGSGKWNTYLERNLKTPERLMNFGNGRYTVDVSFLVNKEGKISDIYIMHSCEWASDAEVVRIIEGGPSWHPATRGGKPVIYRQRQRLPFIVSGE